AFARELGPGKSLDALLPKLGQALCDHDPAAAADWMLTLPPSNVVDEQVRDAFAALTRSAPAEALHRITQLPIGAQRSAAVGGYLKSLPPLEAVRALTTLISPDEQITHVGAIASRWSNSPDAIAWMQTLTAG